MPDPDLSHSSLGKFIAILLVISLILESLRAWLALFHARRLGQTWFDLSDAPRSPWIRFPENMALAVALLMLAMHLIPVFDPESSSTREPMTPVRLAVYLVTSGGFTLLLLAMLGASQRPLGEFGIRFRSWLDQVRDGRDGFLLALLPTSILMLMTAPIRTIDKQNALLTLLTDAPDMATVAGVCLAAVMIAPLYEEMMFRVILQGWLTAHLKPHQAIPIVAVAFAAIHGLTDGVALLPLAGVLGYVFHRRHSYLSVLVIHGLFNATMLALALLTRD